ncbi:MAG: hypothetical protein ABIV11_01195, partial [Gemmatimonadaceae bacterium]
MIYFVADPSTYHRVARTSTHAFATGPSDAEADELVILGEKRDPRRTLHKQVQYLAKMIRARPAKPGELEALFPGVGAEQRWKDLVELYWARPLSAPFNLFQVDGFDYSAFRNVQTFKRLSESDAQAVFQHLCKF